MESTGAYTGYKAVLMEVSDDPETPWLNKPTEFPPILQVLPIWRNIPENLKCYNGFSVSHLDNKGNNIKFADHMKDTSLYLSHGGRK